MKNNQFHRAAVILQLHIAHERVVFCGAGAVRVDDAGDHDRLVIGEDLRALFGGKVVHDCADGHGAGATDRGAVLVHGMTAQIEAGHLLFHRHAFAGAVFLHVRNRKTVLLRAGLRRVLFPGAEQIHLAGDVVPGLPADAVDHAAGNRDQGLALIAERVEAAGADQVFDSAAVEIFPVHAPEKVFKAAEGTVYPALRLQLGDGAAADALDGGETEADVASGYGKAGLGLVDIGRQKREAEIAAFGCILGDLLTVIENR